MGYRRGTGVPGGLCVVVQPQTHLSVNHPCPYKHERKRASGLRMRAGTESVHGGKAAARAIEAGGKKPTRVNPWMIS